MAYEYTTPMPSNLPSNWGTGGGGGGGGGTDNYNDLSNKPKINDIELAGNKTPDQLGVIGMKGIQAYESMPAGTNGMTVMYTGAQGAYETGAVYRYQSNAWVKIMSAAEAATISDAQIEALFE